MFDKIKSFIRGGLYRLRIIKSLEKISDFKDIPRSEEMFKNMNIWISLYKGYYKPWHELTYRTLAGEQTRNLETINMAKTAASEMASLVFNEKCDISISDENLAEEIDKVFKANKFNKVFQDFLEYQFAHGGMVVKPYVDNSKIILSFVTADGFIPLSWDNDNITEAVFPNEFVKNGEKYTHLEWHIIEDGEYLVRNEVYESGNGIELGKKMLLERFFPGLDEEVPIKGLGKTLFVYFKPNTANNIDTESPLGISIFANALGTMHTIDTIFDSFHREFRLGKKRILVPAQMVKTVADPANPGSLIRYFDDTDETYEAFRADHEEIKDISVELRVEEHISAINAYLNIFAMQTGFSPGTFSYNGQSMKTATEVISEQSKTFKSKQSHETIIEAGIQELVGAIVELAKLYELFNVPDEYDVTVNFDDSIAEDKGAEINQQILLVSGGLTSKTRAIMKVHGVTEEEAKLILKEIIQEDKDAAPDMKKVKSTFFGDEE
jgi:A118 family predicted phage portal protein